MIPTAFSTATSATWTARAKGRVRAVVDDFLLFLMICYPTMHMFDPVDVVLSSPSIDAAVKFFCVCVTFFKVRNPSTLTFPSSLKHSQANHPALEPRA